MTVATPPEQLSDAARSFLSNGPLKLLIGEERVDGVSTFETLDPATGNAIAEVAQAGPEQVDRAVAAARAAFEDGPWASAPAAERGKLIQRLSQLIAENADELAELESLDNGKPVTLAKIVDVGATVAHYEYFAGWPTKIEGDVIPVRAPNTLCYTRKEPVGVCGQIIPWNFPLLMAAWKTAPALAAGCTIVLKPAEQTPLTALRLGELALEAGIPPGVFNVVTGDGETGAAIVDHPGVDKIAFTGSTAVGPGDRGEGRARSQASDARAGRQVAEHHPARRRSGGRDQGLLPGDLLQHRPGLQRRLAAVRAQGAVRRRGGRAGRGGGQDEAGSRPGHRDPDGPARVRGAARAGDRLHRVRQVVQAPSS